MKVKQGSDMHDMHLIGQARGAAETNLASTSITIQEPISHVLPVGILRVDHVLLLAFTCPRDLALAT